jgi:type II secretory ATPase GspE/PulE/Tfp pilus assembly ATPase PilB-like protein
VGCPQCAGTGFRGRTAILEFLSMSDPIRRLVLKHADAGQIQATAIEAGNFGVLRSNAERIVRSVRAARSGAGWREER